MEVAQGFVIGEYEVYPQRSLLSKAGSERRVEPKVMRVLEQLASAAGQVVSRNQLMDSVWQGVIVSDETVTRCVSELRHALEDSSTDPQYIQTIPRKGYRLVSTPVPLAKIHNLAEPEIDVNGIAVLPFVARGPADTKFLADGMHEEVLTTLASISALKVISRTSVQRYVDTVANMREIAAELGVKHILEGRVQRAGDELRINVQLIDGLTDEHLWAQTYNRALTADNVFQLQSEMAQTIATQLFRNISPDEQQRIDRRPTANLDAFESYIRGRQRQRTASFGALEEALALFVEAVELDPNYADAQLAVANVYSDMADTGLISTKDMLDRGRPYVQRALELDPNNGFGMALTAHYDALAGGTVADAVYEQAIKASPNSVESLAIYIDHLCKAGRHADGLLHVERALLLDPLSPQLVHEQGLLELRLGRYDRALLAFAKIAKLDPDNPYAVQGSGLTALSDGRLADSAYWSDLASKLDPMDFENQCGSVFTYDAIGNSDMAQQRLNEALELNSTAPCPLATQVYLRTVEGDHAGALRVARASLASHLEDRWRSHLFCLRAVRDDALRAGEYVEALAWYKHMLPEASEVKPKVHLGNAAKLADFAYLLQASGETGRGHALAEHILEQLPDILAPGVNNFPMGIPDVDALLALGRNGEALAALKRHVESNWRAFWRWSTQANPAHDVLREVPEYQLLIDVIRDDLKSQVQNFNAAQMT